jgi:shikimate dehydrogenase
MNPINGRTVLFYMLAHPIDHVRTPEVLNPLFGERGIDAVMVPLHLRPEDLTVGWEAIRRSRNVRGLVVSVPFKEQAFALSDVHEEIAREVGAANVIRREADGRMIATNFDGQGFLRGLLGGGSDARGRRALLAGAGGAGRAIAFGLARTGVHSLRISDIDKVRAATLAAEVRGKFSDLDVREAPSGAEDYDLLINATPCGLHPETDPLPVNLSALRPGVVVADIIMKPRETPLLRAARAVGCEVRYGAGMLDHQLELMLEFFGYPPTMALPASL